MRWDKVKQHFDIKFNGELNGDSSDAQKRDFDPLNGPYWPKSENFTSILT